jgi:hypothetical protein
MWQEHRLYTQNTLKNFGFGRRSVQDTILRETDILLETLQGIKGDNFIFKPILQGVFSNVIMSIIFNQRYDYFDSKMLRIKDILHNNLSDSEFAGILDFMPILEHLPGDMFRAKKLIRLEKTIDAFVQEKIDEHKATLDENNLRDFVDAYLCELNKKGNGTNSTFSGTCTLSYRVHPRFLVGFMLLDFSFMCMLCRSLFVLLAFFFWSLCCLSFFDLRILI